GLTLAGLGFAAAQTTTSSPPSSTTTTTAAPAPPEHKGGHPGRLGFGSGFGALHGEFTTRAPGGGWRPVPLPVRRRSRRPEGSRPRSTRDRRRRPPPAEETAGAPPGHAGAMRWERDQ